MIGLEFIAFSAKKINYYLYDIRRVFQGLYKERVSCITRLAPSSLIYFKFYTFTNKSVDKVD